MQPGGFSAAGFLGKGERLLPLLEEDRLTLDALDLDFGMLGSGLEELIRRAASKPSRRAYVPPHSVAVSVTKGFQICPWAADPHAGQCSTGEGAAFSRVNWQIKN